MTAVIQVPAPLLSLRSASPDATRCAMRDIAAAVDAGAIIMLRYVDAARRAEALMFTQTSCARRVVTSMTRHLLTMLTRHISRLLPHAAPTYRSPLFYRLPTPHYYVISAHTATPSVRHTRRVVPSPPLHAEPVTMARCLSRMLMRERDALILPARADIFARGVLCDTLCDKRCYVASIC